MFAVLLILLLAAAPAAAQQALALNLPVGVLAVDVTSPTRVVFASVGPGLLRSRDGGLTWDPVFFRAAGQPQPVFNQLVVDPTTAGTVYAFTEAEEGGVWKTIDAGDTWTMSNAGLPTGGVSIGPAVLLRNQARTLYAKAGDGFYKTTDGAATWTRLGALSNAQFAFAVDPSDPTRMYTSAGSAVYRSATEGASWSIASTLPIGAGTVITSLVVDLSNPDIILATALGSGSGIGIYRSSDRGANFTRVLEAPSTALVADPDPASGIFYASDLERTCFDRSANRGANWQRLCFLPQSGGARIVFDFLNPSILWTATTAGVYRSADRGTNWDQRPGTVRPTLGVPSVLYHYTLPPGGEGQLELPLRVVETDRWTVPLAVTTSGEPWLSVSDAGGLTPSTPRVRVSAGDLTPGSYTATITINSSRAFNSRVEIPVRLTVQPPPPALSYTASTFAGTGQSGTFGDGGPANRAAFGNPDSVTVDLDGAVLLSDPGNNAVRKITPAGIISRAAGNGQPAFTGDGGEAAVAGLRAPRGLATDPAGRWYIADTGNNRVRRVANGVIDTAFADATGARGIAADASGNLYIALPEIHLVARVTASGTVSRFAGTGVSGFRGDGGEARFARLSAPNDVAVDHATGNVYIADTENHRIRVVTPDGRIRTLAGNGSAGFQGDGPDASLLALARPHGVGVDPSTSAVIIADTENHRIRIVTREGAMRTIAGTGTSGFSGDTGPAQLAQLRGPTDATADRDGNIYIADSLNSRIRKLAAPVMPRAVSLVGPPLLIAPGGYFSIYGAGLAGATLSASAVPFPATLGGVTVTLNDRHCRLSYVSPTQINALVPVDTEAGTARLRIIRDGQPGPEIAVDVAPAAPAVLVFGANRAVAVNQDGRVNTGETPAVPDSVITVYLTGIGLTDVPVGDGQTAPADPLARPNLAAAATIGGQPAEVLFLGLAPGYVGLAQANLRVPALEAGDHTVSITVGGAASNAPLVTVTAP